MPFNSWGQTLRTQHAAGTALANSTTPTSLLNPQAKMTLPEGIFGQNGTMVHIRAGGRMGTVVTTPGTFTFDFKYGSTIILTTGALSLNTTAQTNANWSLWADLILFTEGSSAAVYGQGEFTSRAALGSAAVATSGVLVVPFPDTSPTTGTAFDATASGAIDIFGTWSIANASNTIRLDRYSLTLCN